MRCGGGTGCRRRLGGGVGESEDPRAFGLRLRRLTAMRTEQVGVQIADVGRRVWGAGPSRSAAQRGSVGRGGNAGRRHGFGRDGFGRDGFGCDGFVVCEGRAVWRPATTCGRCAVLGRGGDRMHGCLHGALRTLIREPLRGLCRCESCRRESRGRLVGGRATGVGGLWFLRAARCGLRHPPLPSPVAILSTQRVTNHSEGVSALLIVDSGEKSSVSPSRSTAPHRGLRSIVGATARLCKLQREVPPLGVVV